MIKRQFFPLLFLLIISLLSLAACGPEGSEATAANSMGNNTENNAPEATTATPDDVVTAFLDGMIAGDVNTSVATYCTDATLFTYDDPDSVNAHIAITLYSEMEYAILETTTDETAGTATVTTLITTTDFAKAAERLLSDENYMALTPEDQETQYEAYILSEIIESGAGGLNRTLEVAIALTKTSDSWQIIPDENLSRAMLGASY